MRFDLEVTNTTAYEPYDANLNGLNGRFAQINLKANSQVGLRVTIKASCCATTDNCVKCENEPSSFKRAMCYASGCCCFGVTVYEGAHCSGSAKEAKRINYAAADG